MRVFARRDTQRWAAPALAIAGGGAVALGSYLPWVSYFAGLVPLRGLIGRNGRLLLAAGILGFALGIVLAIVRTRRVRGLTRWATGTLGAAIDGAAIWLLIGVWELTRVRASNAMLAPRPGMGLVVVLVGGTILALAACVPDAPVSHGGSIEFDYARDAIPVIDERR